MALRLPMLDRVGSCASVLVPVPLACLRAAWCGQCGVVLGSADAGVALHERCVGMIGPLSWFRAAAVGLP